AGHVNRHNCRIWADDQPNALQEWERDLPKVNVWMGITKSKVYGPYMFAERTVTGRYNIPRLIATLFGATVDTRWHVGFCCLPTRWSTSTFCQDCPGLPKCNFSWEMVEKPHFSRCGTDNARYVSKVV
ncbi:hypothetical protein C0J52_07255, partial [Blattella germanica]